uniref:D-amino acid dehydrogenase 1 small subunit n=1 Tax=Lygus hesperus TaxID=30085 RepID=A0A0A9YFC9_LYGHE
MEASKGGTTEDARRGVEIVVEEHCTMHVTLDGQVLEGKLQGEMKLQVEEPKYTNIAIQTSINKGDGDGVYRTILRPELSKQAFEVGILVPSMATSDSSSEQESEVGAASFAVSSTPLVVCKWMITQSMIKQHLRTSHETNFTSPFVVPFTIDIRIHSITFEMSRVDMVVQ